MFEAYRKRGSLERSFADLVCQMLAWEPRDRLTAAEALQHPCMHQYPLEEQFQERPKAKTAKTGPSATEQPADKEEISTEEDSYHVEPTN